MHQALCAVRGDATDITGVLERMEAIDCATVEADGVSAFNRVYHRVTEEVLDQVAGIGYDDDRFMTRLDVRFANRYFDAYAADARGERCPEPWRPLFEHRASGAAPIQFALAGMNAHINHDLPLALVQTCDDLRLAPVRGTPHHRDFDRTNEVLAVVQQRIADWFATGAIAAIDDACGKLDDAFAMWSIAEARRVAWEHAEVLWELRDDPRLRAAYERTLQRMVGFAGRGLLL